MDLANSTALVTGSNRGLGLHLVEHLLSRGATVYAAARNPDTIRTPGVRPIQLDITDPASVTAAAAHALDVNLLINNAGNSTNADLLTGPMAEISAQIDIHYIGTLSVIRAFAPTLAANGGGTILNVLSVLSWVGAPPHGPYAAAKSAAWSMTNTLRLQLAAQNTHVAGLHVGYMDTDMTAGIDAPKSDPATIAAIALDALAAGSVEILADDLSRDVQQALAGGVHALYPELA